MTPPEIDPADLAAFSELHPRFDSTYQVLWLDLDHGKANEMGVAQLDALEALVEYLNQNDRVRCLAATSQRRSAKGKPIFIAGANVTERVGWSADDVDRHVQRQRLLMRRLRELPLFTVALTHGVTLGWGAEFLLTMDYTLATPTAKIALPETGLGILPGAGGTAHLAGRIGLSQALRLGCTGEALDGAQALAIGMVDELVQDLGAGRERIESLARALARRSPTAVAAYKRAVVAGLGENSERREALEATAYRHCQDTGQAALGRASFAQILAGETPEWGKRQ